MRPNNPPDDSSEMRYQMHVQAFDLMEAGEIERSTEILQELLRLDPRDPHVDHIKGFCLSGLGLQDQAIPLLRRAARLLPGRSEPQVTLGIALMRKGELAEAQTILEGALGTDPDCFYSLTNLAACLLAAEKAPERAERLLRKADLLMPHDQAVWANLGRALALQGKAAEADAAFLHAIELDPDAEAVKQIIAFYPHLGGSKRPVDPPSHWPMGSRPERTGAILAATPDHRRRAFQGANGCPGAIPQFPVPGNNHKRART